MINKLATSDAHPSTNRQAPTITAPTTMNGLRRPHLDFDLSENTPTTGCIMRPDNGPAIHTNDVRLFVKPSESR